MSILTGPDSNIYADTTIPGTAAVAMTAFEAAGNSLILIVTTTTGGCVSLTFTAEVKVTIAGTETAYADVIDRDSVWSMVCTTPHVAGVYAIPMEGLDLIPRATYRLSYTAATAAGKLKVDALNWENPKGGGAEVSIGDVVVDIDAIAVDVAALEILLADVPNVIGTDGAAGPTKVLSIGGTNSADGKIQEVHVDAAGDLQVDVLTLPGGLTGYAEDTEHTTGDIGVEMLAVRNDALATLVDTDGDYAPIQVDASGSVYTRDSLGNAILTTIDADTGVIAGDTTSLDTKTPALGTAAMVGSSPVTIATDDTMFTALDTAVDIIAGDTTSLDTKAPALGTAAMVASRPVTIATDDTMMTALDTALDIVAGDTTSLDTKTAALGTAAMVASSPVTIATDDTMFTALDTAVDIIAGDTTSLDTKTAALGTAAMVASSPVTIATDDTMFTALDTAVDIIAGDTTSLDTKQPALGTAAMAASSPVTMATDDVLSTATGIHDVAAAAKLGGVRLLGNATAALQTAVSATLDDAKINTDLSGQVRLASHVIANVADNVTEIDPISEHYSPATILVSYEAVAADPGASYAPDAAGHALTYGHQAAVQLYINGGVGAAAVDRTVTVTIEASMGLLVAAAVRWIDVSKSLLDLNTGLSNVSEWTSTGDDPQEYLLSLGSVPFSHFRVKYDWDADPSVTNGAVVVNTFKSAL